MGCIYLQREYRKINNRLPTFWKLQMVGYVGIVSFKHASNGAVWFTMSKYLVGGLWAAGIWNLHIQWRSLAIQAQCTAPHRQSQYKGQFSYWHTNWWVTCWSRSASSLHLTSNYIDATRLQMLHNFNEKCVAAARLQMLNNFKENVGSRAKFCFFSFHSQLNGDNLSIMILYEVTQLKKNP